MLQAYMHRTGRLLRKTSCPSLLLKQLREPATYRFHFDSAHLFTSLNNFPCLHRTQVSVNEVGSDCELSKCGVCQLVPVLSWLLHNPDRLPADWSPPVYRLAHLPGFQATRLPSSSPRVAADNLHCTPTLCGANWTRRFKLWSSLLALHVKRWHNFQEPKAKEEECQSWHPGCVAGPVSTSHFSYSLHSDRTGLLIL